MQHLPFSHTIYQYIRDDGGGNRQAAWVDQFITMLILLSVSAVVLESFVELHQRYGVAFHWFELISVSVFSVEYVLRIYTATHRFPESKRTIEAMRRFVLSGAGIIDLLAVLPFYVQILLPLYHHVDMRFLRLLRMMRLLRIFKLQRHSSAFRMVGDVLREARADIAVTLFVTSILVVIASGIMYYIESDVQPDKFAHMGDAFWWAIATLTTVGYGDVYPVTAMGKLLSGIIAVLGIGMVALPTGVISSAFIQQMQNNKQQAEQDATNNEHQLRLEQLEKRLALQPPTNELLDLLARKDQRIEQLEARIRQLESEQQQEPDANAGGQAKA